MKDLIGRYAELEASQIIAQRSGKAFPIEFAREMAQIEALAKSRFTPEQLAAAMQHVEHAKVEAFARYAAQERAKKEADFAAGQDKMSRNLTKNIANQKDGLSVDQFHQVLDEGKLTIPSRRVSATDTDEIVRARTRSLDKTGNGYTKKEWTKRMDALTEALVVKGDEEEFNRLASQYNADPDQLRKAAKEWTTGRIALGLDERRSKSASTEPTTVEVSDSDRRRAQISMAWLDSLPEEAPKTASEVREVQDQFSRINDEIPKDYIEDEGRRGDVARAFERLEREQGDAA